MLDLPQARVFGSGHSGATLGALSTHGPIFLCDGQPWRWKGASAFQLLDRFAKGEDLGAFLADCAGFNVLRVWPYVPAQDWGASAWESPAPAIVLAFLEAMAAAGFFVELTLLTDDAPARINPTIALVRALTAARPANLLIEVANEPITHKAIDTAALRRVCEDSGFLFSSGDYEDSRRWFGSFLTFHSGRDAEWPRRAHDALDYYHGGGPNFRTEPACRVPCVADEPIRPDQAGFNEPDFRAYFGACALLGAGATFHCESGKFARRFTDAERRIAAVCLDALDAFPVDAPLGAYRRPVERSLRTYVVGDHMVRIRPDTSQAPEPGWLPLDPDGILWTR